MSERSKTKRTGARWFAVAGGVVVMLAMFVSGLAVGIIHPQNILAERDGHEQDRVLDPNMVITPTARIPEMNVLQNPVSVEVISTVVTPEALLTTTSTAGTTTRPAAGRYLHLERIGRYYSLPDDVTLKETLHFYSCPLDPDTRCPITPLYIYQRGDAEIGIDSVGEIFTNWSEADSSRFPFFTDAGGNE